MKGKRKKTKKLEKELTKLRKRIAELEGSETNQVRVEDALRTCRNYLSCVLNGMHEGVMVVGRDYTIMDVNDRFLELYKGTHEEIIGRTCHEITHQSSEPCDEMGYPCPLKSVLETGTPACQEHSYKDREGRDLIVELRARPLLGPTGDIESVIEISHDVTALKRAEGALRESGERLQQQERMAAVGQLAVGIAHDFKNILTIVLLHAQILRNSPQLSPDLVTGLDAILDESNQASELVQQILDFSRRAMLDARPIDLASSVKGTVHILRRTLPENIQLTLDAPSVEAEEIVVNADPTRIQQALMHLATNARDAMLPKGGGKLRISLSRVHVEAGEEPLVTGMTAGNWVCLSISDTGIGMTQEVQSHIFEPFFTTKEPGKGLGLGLVQVYGIVRQHEGYIQFETEEGQGTTFHICLPSAYYVEEEELLQEDKSAVAPEGLGGETILLVEDEEGVRKVGQSVLESLGYRVMTAVNGQEALKVYQAEERVDLLVTDAVMPQMGGVRLLRELQETTPHLKAIAITGYVMPEDLEALKRAGFLDIVHKPFDVPTLAQAVRQVLDSD